MIKPSILKPVCLSMTVILVASSALTSVQAQAPANAANLTAGELIDKLAEQLTKSRTVSGLEVMYRYDQEALEPNSLESWVPWGEFTNIIKPSERGKLFVRFRYPQEGYIKPGTTTILLLEASSDNEIKGDLRFGDEKRTGQPGVILKPATGQGLPLTTYAHYFRMLAYPVLVDPDDGETGQRRYPPGDYWLPDALVRNKKSYRVKPTLEQVQGIWCHVLERPGLDNLWIQTEPVVLVRRRQFRWAENEALRQDVACGDYKQVAADVWFPFAVTVDRYAAPWDPPTLAGRIACRQKIKVISMEVREFPDSTFRIQIPRGAYVADFTTKGDNEKPIYFVNDSSDPFQKAAEIYRTELKEKRRFWTIVILNSAGLIALLVGGLLWWKRRSLVIVRKPR